MATPEFDPNQQMPLLAFSLMMPSLRITAWARKDMPMSEIPIEPGTSEDRQQLLDAISRYTGNEDIPAFRAALAAGEHDAMNAMQHVINDCRGLVPELVDHVQNWYTDGNFQGARSQGPDIAIIAAGVELEHDAAVASFFAARSFWKSDDFESAVSNYECAIVAAQRSGVDADSLLSACHDNLGGALIKLDRYDAAIRHLRIAEGFETEPLNQLQIHSNLADAHLRLGEYGLAVTKFEEVVDGLKVHCDDPLRIAIALDNLATALTLAGEYERSLDLNEQAAQLMPAYALDARRINNSTRLSAYCALGRFDEASALFQQTWDLIVTQAHSFDVEPFRTGYRAALPHLLPETNDVWGHLAAARAANAGQQWEVALQHLVAGANIASDAGDGLTYLRCRANIAAVLAQAQDDDAWVECRFVHQQALAMGLALPIALVEATMAAILRGRSDRGAELEALEHSARALAFADLRDELVAEADLPHDHIERDPAIDRGVALLHVAGAAAQAHAYQLAEECYRAAIDMARMFSQRFGELNRMIGLLALLDSQPERRAEADAVADQLRLALALADTAPLNKMGILRGLAFRSDNAQAVSDLSAATKLYEQLRADREPGYPRSDLDQAYSVYPGLLRRLHATKAPDAEAYAVLQAMRARRLMEILTARAGDTAAYQPPDIDEIKSLLARQPRLTTFVDVTGIEDGLRAYLVDLNGLRTIDVTGDVSGVIKSRFGDVRSRARDAVATVANSRLLIDLATAITRALEPGSTILLAVDDELANLPLHAIPFGDSHWGAVVSMGRIPAVGALRYTSAGRAWSGQSIVAGDSNDDLRFARQECGNVGKALGVTPLIGRVACTLDAVRNDLTRTPGTQLDVVHLAVHGRADPRRGGLSSLLFAGDPPQWVSFADLAALPWRTNLIVFSGCSTAVGGPKNGTGLYGVAQAAAEAGATTVIASLWPVNDTSAAIFMTAFYRELDARRGSGVVDLREIMDIARDEVRGSPVDDEPRTPVRDGRELILEGADPETPESDSRLAAMIHWAPFVLIGEPTMPI